MKNTLISTILFLTIALILPSYAFGQDYTTTIATCTSYYDPNTGGVSVTCTPVYGNPFSEFYNHGRHLYQCDPADNWHVQGNYPTVKLGNSAGIVVQGVGGVSCGQGVSLTITNIDQNNNSTLLCSSGNSTEIAFGYVPYTGCSFTLTQPGDYNLYISTNKGINMSWPLTVVP